MKTNIAPASANGCGFLPAAAVFSTGVFAMWLTPLGRLVMFPYELLATKDSNHHWRHLLTSAQAMQLSLVQWGAATILFAALARKESRWLSMPLALAGYTLVTVFMHVTVRALGLDFYWELWR